MRGGEMRPRDEGERDMRLREDRRVEEGRECARQGLERKEVTEQQLQARMGRQK